MKSIILALVIMAAASANASSEDRNWYKGDDKCPSPIQNSEYSAPYNPLDHQNEYPSFPDADKNGWSCSYTREDGTIVQYGDSRTPQEQWLSVWGSNHDDLN